MLPRKYRKMPNGMYGVLEPFLEEHYQNRTRRRPLKYSLRMLSDGVYFVLRTGCQWNAVPDYYPPPSTLHRHFQQWSESGIINRFWRRTIELYDYHVGLELDQQFVDGCITKAPYGGDCVGRNPTDRGKGGTKRSVLVERNGVTLGVAFDSANRHDVRLLIETLNGAVQYQDRIQVPNIFLDKAYDARWVRSELERRGYQHHIPRRGEDYAQLSVERSNRWIVEVSNAWLNNYRRIRIRKERGLRSYETMVKMALSSINLIKIENHN